MRRTHLVGLVLWRGGLLLMASWGLLRTARWVVRLLRRMEEQATQLGADAVINIRFVTSQVMTGAAELLVYGTAVKLEPDDPGAR